MRVALLLAAVVLVLVGLPLCAIVWSRARYLRRPSVSSWIDVLHAEARRRQLSASQIAMITQAVDRGDAAPPELQGVAAQTAAAKVACLESALRLPRRRRLAAGITVLLIVAVGTAIADVVAHRPVAGAFVLVEALLASVVIPRGWGGQLRGARRAVELNGGSRIEEPTNAGAADRNGTDT